MDLSASAATGNVVTSGSPYRVVLKLAMPTVLAMLAQSAVNEMDIIFFSWMPQPESSNAQAALLPCLILLWMFGGSLSAISVGTQAIAARRFAQGKPLEAGAVALNSMTFALVSSCVLTAIGYVLLPHALDLLIKVPAVRAQAESYMHWRLLGIISMVTSFSLKAFFDGIGKTTVHMVASIVMNLANVALCMALIFGHYGAPRMGMAGAGLAGCLSSWLGLVIMVGWIVLPRYQRAHRPFDWRGLSRSLVNDILRLSIPSAVATLAVMTGFALFSAIVSQLDHANGVATSPLAEHAEAVNSAATTVIVGILKLTFTACLAFGTSTATLVSQSLGEGNTAKAERFGWVSVTLGLMIFGVVGLGEGVVFTRAILGAVTRSDGVFHAALVPLRMMGLATPLIATGMILTQALFGAGNTRFVMIAELCLHFLCLVPLAWLLGVELHLGLVGIWSSALVYVVLLTSVMVLKFRSGDWKTIKI
ncbi:MAG TPA: MATE family efflux transporter [Polyangiaceae bacterium]|jgi:putative MATE family efflux protein|nr:MATE family efflux transporter [Polyangiaceae bacterium]